MDDEFDIDREAVLQTFLTESEEGLHKMEEALIALENLPEDEELLQTIYRNAHTLKGNSAFLGFTGLTEFAHVLEDILERLTNRQIPITRELITLLLQSRDALLQMLPAAASGIEKVDPAHSALLEQLASRAPTIEKQEREGSLSLHTTELPIKRGKGQSKDLNDRTKTLRVDVDKLDRMLNLIGEISIARGRYRQIVAELGGKIGEDLLETYWEADSLYLELQEEIMKIRMVPVGPTFRQYIRTARDVATAHGKIARLVIEGGDVEVDTRVIEHLKDPITHMIRNALDHGIESPEERKRIGKDPCGQITLRAYHVSGSIVIELIDDGAGVNRKRIEERALLRGIIEEAEKLTDQEIYRLIFEPGFSTAETVTDLSGRGVGMDIVRRNIETLRGSVSVESRSGEGTTITIRLPLTLAIIDGFLVGVGSETYVIPVYAVIECLELPQEEQRYTDDYGVINLRGEVLPYLRLRALFNLGGTIPRRENIVVVHYDGGSAGIVVDNLYGESQTVIKPLGKLFKGLQGISGSAVMGNGRVALILDIPALLRHGRQMLQAEAI
jgi:two-component system, chemotaxis family, sensor kinase CheA